MAVDYREVNLQLDGTVNQLPYQPMQFQKLGGQKYFAKVDNQWVYHQLSFGMYRFLAIWNFKSAW